jgi:hypothetical protein
MEGNRSKIKKYGIQKFTKQFRIVFTFRKTAKLLESTDDLSQILWLNNFFDNWLKRNT